MINQQILNYTIVQELGRGGMATVYKAKHNTFDNRFVAIKILDAIFSQNEDIVRRFINEAKIMASLEHQNIIKVIDFENKDNRLSIIMELLDGKDLKNVISENKLTKEQNLNLFKQVLNAFEYAHKKNIVHRDIKPSNVFITDNLNTAKVLDFGIAKLLETDNQMTMTGFQMGTPVFMSPEQVKGIRNLDHRTDIYSLGVLLFYMFSRNAPYDQNTSQYEILTKIVNEPLPQLKEFPQINSLISKATQKKPEHRFQSCNEFIQAINNLNELSGFIEVLPTDSEIKKEEIIEEKKEDIKKEPRKEEKKEEIISQKEETPKKEVQEEKTQIKPEKKEQKIIENKSVSEPKEKTAAKKKKNGFVKILFLLILLSALFVVYKFFNPFSKNTFEINIGGKQNDDALGITVDENGVFVVGLTKSMNDNMDWIVVRTDLNGKEKYRYNFDGFGRGDAAHSIIPVGENKYLIIGGVYKDDELKAQNRVMMVDKDCNIIWDKEYGFEGWDEAVDVTQADDKNFIFVYTDNTGKNTRVGIYKINNSGNLIWEKSIGSGGDYTPRSILKYEKDKFIVTGKITYSDDYEKAFILIIDKNGKILEENEYGENNQKFDAEDIILCDDGNFILTGYSQTNKNYKELWLAKLNKDAEITHQRSFQGNQNTVGLSLAKLPDNKYVAVGYTSQDDKKTDGYIIIFDQNLNKISQKTYGGQDSDSFKAVTVFKKSIYIAGYSESFGNNGKDIWILKLNPQRDL